MPPPKKPEQMYISSLELADGRNCPKVIREPFAVRKRNFARAVPHQDGVMKLGNFSEWHCGSTARGPNNPNHFLVWLIEVRDISIHNKFPPTLRGLDQQYQLVLFKNTWVSVYSLYCHARAGLNPRAEPYRLWLFSTRKHSSNVNCRFLGCS